MLPIVGGCQALDEDVTTVATLLKEFKSRSPSLLNAQLAALNSVVNKMTLSLLVDHIPRILDSLDPSVESSPPNCGLALGLFEKLIHRDPIRVVLGSSQKR
jgi:hypothetical protein